MKYKAMKFNIGDNPQLSARVQEVLFSAGYTWHTAGINVDYVNHPYLYTEKDGHILHGDEEGTFFTDSSESININWMVEPLAPLTQPAPTYALGDYFILHDSLHIIGSVAPKEVVFIELSTGLRGSDPETVGDTHNITEEEMDRILLGAKYEHVANVVITVGEQP